MATNPKNAMNAQLLETLKANSQRAQEIDELLDAAAGSTDAGRRATVNFLVNENQSAVDSAFNQIVSQFDKVKDDRQFAALVEGISRNLLTHFKERVDTVVNKVMAERKSVTPTEKPSDEDMKTLSDERKILQETDKATRFLLTHYGESDALVGIPEVKPRRGRRAGTKTTPVWQQFNYVVDSGAPTASLRKVVDQLGTPEEYGVKEFKEELEKQGISKDKLGEGWETEINGHKVVATRDERFPLTPEAGIPDEDDEEENETEEETEDES